MRLHPYKQTVYEYSLVLREKEYENILKICSEALKRKPQFTEIKQIAIHLGYKEKDYVDKVITLDVVKGTKEKISR